VVEEFDIFEAMATRLHKLGVADAISRMEKDHNLSLKILGNLREAFVALGDCVQHGSPPSSSLPRVRQEPPPDEAEAFKALEPEVEDEPMPTGEVPELDEQSYFITFLQCGKRKLHKTSCQTCPVKPGLSSVRYQWVASHQQAEYSDICFKCWPKSDFDRLGLETYLRISKGASSDDEELGSSSEDETRDAYSFRGLVHG
jgi:hypothetical protein